MLRNFRDRRGDEPPFDALVNTILARIAQFPGTGPQVSTWRKAIARAPQELQRETLLSRDHKAELIGLYAEPLDDRPAAPSQGAVRQGGTP